MYFIAVFFIAVDAAVEGILIVVVVVTIAFAVAATIILTIGVSTG